MPTSYTSLLGFALPVTGELSGTWGDTVNDYITKYVDSAVAGTQTISGSQTAVTLTVTNGTTLTQVGSGSSGSAQYAVINCTGNPAGLLTITAPASSRQYLIINATSTSQSVKIVGAGPTTGVTLVTGESAIVAWNGSDYVKVASSTADGVTTFSAGTTGFTPSTATSGAVTLAGTLATTNGGTGLTSFTANGVVYASSTSAIAQSANLTFDGTTLVANNFTDSSLTSGRVTYAGTGGNLVDNANFVFDGSNLGVGTSSVTLGRLQVNQVSGTAVYGTTAGGTGFGGQFWNTDGGTNKFVSCAGAGSNGVFSAGVGASTYMFLDSSGNLGIGTSSPVTKLDVALAAVTPSNTSFHGIVVGPNSGTTSLGQAVGIGFRLRNTAGGAVGGNDLGAAVYGIQADTGANTGSLAFYTRPDAASLAERARITSGGNFGIGTTSPATRLDVRSAPGADYGNATLFDTTSVALGVGGVLTFSGYKSAANGLAVFAKVSGIKENATDNNEAGALTFTVNNGSAYAERMRITSAGFTRPVAYADTVSALGNTGTATTINLLNANVFTATLTGNCTFTLSNPIATGSSSFTLILTNDGTAGRTVAWSGGSFVFPGGASALSRTTTANAVDVWVFFTPNGGTTWYGNIAMKDMKA
jgi:hypothetical protein